MWHRRTLGILLVAFLVLVIFVHSASQIVPDRHEIAEGEYTISTEYGGVGPIETEIFNFHETWQMWRSAEDHYEIEGTRHFESPKDVTHDIRFWLRLSPQLRFEESEERIPIWIGRSGLLMCTFRPTTVHCSTDGDEAASKVDFSLSMEKPFAFSWPASPFSIAALTRQADKRAGHVTEVQFVEVGQNSPTGPVVPIVTSGRIRFLGRAMIATAGKDWQADKFELDAFMSSLPRKSTLWVSDSGLLLKLEALPQAGPRGTLELTRFEDRCSSAPQ